MTDNTQAELKKIHSLIHQPSYAVVYPETSRELDYPIEKRILDWHNKQVKNAVATAEDNLDQYWNKELDKQVEEARVEGAQYIFNMLEANVMLVDDDEISRRKLMGNMYEHLRRYAERNKLKESR